MVYQDYAQGVRAGTTIVDVITDNILNHYNEKINKEINVQLDEVYNNQQASYSNMMNRAISDAQKEIERTTEQLQSQEISGQERSDLKQHLYDQQKQLEWFQNSYDSYSSNPEAKQVRYSFDDVNEYKTFIANATQQNIFGCGCADKLNGQYVFVTNETQTSACKQIASDYQMQTFNTFSGYDVKNLSMDKAYTTTSGSFLEAYDISKMSTDAGKSEQQIKEVMSMVSGMYMSKLEAPNRAEIQNEFVSQFNESIRGRDFDYNRTQETKLANGRDISDYQSDFSGLSNERQQDYIDRATKMGLVDSSGNPNGAMAWYQEDKSRVGLMAGERENFSYQVHDAEAFQSMLENMHCNPNKMRWGDIVNARESIFKKCTDLDINILDVDGNVNVEALEKAVMLGNITQEEMDLVMLTGIENSKFKMNFGVSSLIRRTAREMELPIQDFVHLAQRTKQSLKLIKSARRIKVTFQRDRLARKIRDKEGLVNLGEYDEKKLQKSKDKLEKLEKKLKPKKDGKVKSNLKIAKNKLDERLKHLNPATVLQDKINKRAYKMLQRRANNGGKISRFLVRRIDRNHAFRKGLGEFFKKFNVRWNRIKMAILKKVGVFVLGMMLMSMGIIIIVAVLSSISGFAGGTGAGQGNTDTIGYTIYKDLKKEETKWLKACADTSHLWGKKNKIKWGTEYVNMATYVNGSVRSATSDGSNISINPFNFTPKDSSALKTANSFDGGSEFTVNSSAGSNHTSNIKDILSMADVMFGNDMDSNSLLGQTMGKADKKEMQDLKNSDSFIKRWFANYCEMEVNNTKSSGINITAGYNGVEEEPLDEGTYSTSDVANIETYCTHLFNASHQETFTMEVMVYPINTGTDTKNADATLVGDAGVNTNIVTECPENGCASSSAFKWVIGDKNGDGVNENALFLGLEDTNGIYHDMTSSVLYDANLGLTKKAVDVNDACIKVNEDYDANSFAFYFLSLNPCWDYVDGQTITEYVNDDNGNNDKYTYDKSNHRMIRQNVSYQTNPDYTAWKNNFDANFDTEKYKVVLRYVTENNVGGNAKQKVMDKYNSDGLSKSMDFNTWCEMEGYKDTNFCKGIYKSLNSGRRSSVDLITEERFGTAPLKYIKSTDVDTVTWNCKGHSCHYCGGHLKIHTTGQVYAMTTDQLNMMGGEEKVDKKEDEVFISCYDRKKLDKSSIEKASQTGLNIIVENGKWSTSTLCDVGVEQNTYSQGLKNAKSIFDIDYMLRYGDIFNCKWQDYEGWTKDMQQIACLKASMDWGEMYGFSPELTLGCGSLTSDDIKMIVKEVEDYQKRVNGYKLLPDEKSAIELALSLVGTGQYSMAHHGHGFMGRCGSNEHCNITDCSGFTSYVNTRFPESNQSKICGSSTDNMAVGVQTTASYVASAMPKALWSTYGNWGKVRPASTIVEGGSHAMFVIGYVDKEFTLSDGTVIQANKPITVDCTTVEEPGNIYLNSFNYGQPQVKDPVGHNVYVFPLE